MEIVLHTSDIMLLKQAGTHKGDEIGIQVCEREGIAGAAEAAKDQRNCKILSGRGQRATRAQQCDGAT